MHAYFVNEVIMMRGLFEKCLIENELPIKQISELALKEGNSKKPVYKIHKWWARRLGAVVRALLIGATMPYEATEKEFWKRFYSKNELNLTVLDPFMGGGTILVESKKMGLKTIGVDIDPLACFITKKEIDSLDYDLSLEMEKLYTAVGQRIQEFYLTEVGGEKCHIINSFWVYTITCPQCSSIVETHPHYKLFYDKKAQYVFCKFCGEVHTVDSTVEKFTCDNCSKVTEFNYGTYKRGSCTCQICNQKIEASKEIKKKKVLKMFALEYEKDGKRYFKKADTNDLNLFKQVEEYAKQQLHNYYIPEAQIPVKNRTDARPISHGYLYYKDLFNSRQLISLAMLYSEIRKIKNPAIREWLIIAFSDALASNNMLCNYAYGYRKLTPLFGIHAYTVPVRPVENNVWGSEFFGRGNFRKSLNKVIEAKLYCKEPYESQYKDEKLIKKFTGEKIHDKVTSNQNDFYSGKANTLILNSSSEKLDDIKNNSVDLVLTDPPYYDNLHYSELADFYYQWLMPEINNNNLNPLNNSLFVHQINEEEQIRYEKRLLKIFKECHVKLRDLGMMIFSYHHNKIQAWSAMGNAIKQSGFVVTNVFPVRSEGNSGYHTSENSIKWDSVIVLRKSNYYKEKTILSLDELIDKWEKYFKRKHLDLKKCDKTSFYRSLVVQAYSKQQEKNIDDLLKIMENKIQSMV